MGNDQKLGQGRSGVVFSSHDEAGRALARKVFSSDAVTKVVHYVLSGAPNPYIWNEPAIQAAVLRRGIVDALVKSWFGSKLRIAPAFDYGWNRQFRAFEMRCELICGLHVALHHPFTFRGDRQLADVVWNVMKPLQARLTEAGFDGLVWQAGRGNPVALNNFMCEGKHSDGGYRWVWIDLESGVPALIPINPLDLLLFYLPKSLRHGGPLFDDVDIAKLRAYLNAHAPELEGKLNRNRLRELHQDIDALEENQRQWKSLARHMRSITYRLAKGAISQDQADWYARHPFRWYRMELGRGLWLALRKLGGWLLGLVGKLARIRLGQAIRACWAFICSQQYRTRLARDYVGARIAKWQGRHQLTDKQGDELRQHLKDEETSSYLTDFGVHVAVKPFGKMLQWWVVPALWTVGLIDEVVFTVLLVFGGGMVRTLYTFGRLIQNTFLGREKPWVALLVGAMPVFGNLAYPVQIVATSMHAKSTVARFILYDTFSQFGQWVPIWGGPDTLIEHLLNRCPNLLIRSRSVPAVDST